MLTKSQKSKVKRALAQHEKYRNSYHWTNMGNASSRRHTEEMNNWEVSFKHKGHEYKYVSDVTVSCRNFYYRGAFYLDGEKKTVRLFKGLI